MESNSRILAKNALLNGIRQVLSIIFPLLTFSYVSRILGADCYGKINFSFSVISYIALIAGLGVYNYAVRECAKDLHSDSFEDKVNEIFTLNMYSTVIAYLVLGGLMIYWPKLQNYTSILLIQCTIVLFQTVGMEWLNSVYEDYLYITVRYTVCQLISVGLIFLLVRVEEDYLLYVFAYVLGSVLAYIANLVHIRRRYHLHIKLVSYKRALKHLKPVILLFGSTVATTIYINSDVTLIGIMLDDTNVGYYSVVVKIYSMIKALFNALLLVGMPRFSKMFSNDSEHEVNKNLNFILGCLIAIILPAMAGMMMLPKQIIHLIAGAQYVGASTALCILAISLLFATTACFFIYIIMIPKAMDKLVLYASVISAVVNILLNLIFIPKWGINGAAITTAISELIMLSAGIICTWKLYRAKVMPYVGMSMIGVVIVWICTTISKRLVDNDIYILILAIASSLILYGIVLGIWGYQDYKRTQKKSH